MVTAGEAVHVWKQEVEDWGLQETSVPYSQFYCESKTALNEIKGVLKTKKKIII